MDKQDIRDVRRWHRAAALRARSAGFDLVYVYAGHDLGLAMHFISRRTNRRTDDYGGSLENRVRFLRELIEDTKDAVGDRCGVVVRLAVDQLLGPGGITAEAEGREVIECLADLPDLWDVNVADWSNDSVTARFADEGYQEPYIAFVKSVTRKPVVGVGRYTSPDAMVSLVRRGVMDLIGAARPSIADPFLPRKIDEGRDRRDPRMHRLQHLRDRRQPERADSLHAEPDDGRGMAPRLASGAHRARAQQRHGLGRRRRAGRPGTGPCARAAGLRGLAGRGRFPARRPPAP